ncbi:MAG: DHH family phosphoesterase [Candidatus Altimarinota bacterium]
MQELFLEAGRAIDKAQKILCISHRRPDGDTLGASNSLYWGMKTLGKDVEMACVDDIPARYFFMDDIRKNIKEFNFEDYDLIFVSDAGASYMTQYDQIYPEIFKGKVPVINLDHHSSNDNFGTINIVDVNSASTTILIFKIFNFLNIKITPQAATAMLCGIYNDTGSLMHSNTTLEVFEITGKLVELGGNVNVVAKNLFNTTPVSTMKLWGKILERASVNDQGVAFSVITNDDFKQAGARSDELAGVVDFLNSIPNTKFTVLLNEDEKGNVKGSFRTRRDDIDLAELAGHFGGGGHKKAAGFTMPGRLHREIRWTVKPAGQEENLAEPGDLAVASSKNNALNLLGDILQIPSLVKEN